MVNTSSQGSRQEPHDLTQNRNGSTYSTKNRWDTKDVAAFALWRHDAIRAIRQRTDKAFVGSSRPNITDMDNDSESLPRKATKKMKADLEVVQRLAQEWDKHNETMYDILMASVNLDETQILEVESLYGEDMDGHGMLAWLDKKGSYATTDRQLQLKSDILDITISPDASPDELETALKTIEIKYPKVHSWDTSPQAIVDHAISLFPPDHYCASYVTGFQNLFDLGMKKEFESFAEFRTLIVDHARVQRARTATRQPPQGMHAAFATFNNRDGSKRPSGNDCTICDFNVCRARGKPGDCKTFTPVEPKAFAGLSSKQKYFLKFYRLYAKEHRLTTMKGVRIPREWWNKQKEKARSSKATATSHTTGRVGALSAEVDEPANEMDTADFWAALQGDTANATFDDDPFGLLDDVKLESDLPDGHTESCCSAVDEEQPVAPQERDGTDDDSKPIECMQTLARNTHWPRNADVSPTDVVQRLHFDNPSEHSTDHTASIPPTPDHASLADHLSAVRARQGPKPAPSDASAPSRGTPSFAVTDSFTDSMSGLRRTAASAQAQLAATVAELLAEREAKDTIRIQFDEFKTDQTSKDAENAALITNLQRRVLAVQQEKSKLRVATTVLTNSNSLKTTGNREKMAAIHALQQELHTCEQQGAAADHLTSTLRRDNAALRCQVEQNQLHLATANERTMKQAVQASISKAKLQAIESLSRTKSTKPLRMRALQYAIGVISGYMLLQRTSPRISILLRRIIATIISTFAAHGSTLLLAVSKSLLATVATRMRAFLVAMAPALRHGMTAQLLTDTALCTMPKNDALAAALKSKGLLYDNACTALMTKSLKGKVGALQSVPTSSFTTIAGEKKFNWKFRALRTVSGTNGASITFTDTWYYNPSLPFDIAGGPALRKNQLGAMLVDADPLDSSTQSHLLLRRCGDLRLNLGRSPNGLDWLAYGAPADGTNHTALVTWSDTENAMLVDVATPTIQSAGVGMGHLTSALTPLQRVVLDHVVRGHPSLHRQHLSAKHSTGGLKQDKEALKQLACQGCDTCNAYKIKLFDPSKKAPADHADDDDDDDTIKLGFDSFGKVSIASAQYRYHYAHIYVWVKKKIAWLLGSEDIAAATLVSLQKQILACLQAWYPTKRVTIVKMDSLSSNRSKEMLAMLENAMIHPRFTPPGQHAFLGDVERWWYPLLVRALIGMRQAGAPRTMWFAAMQWALDVENSLATMLSSKDTRCGYKRADPSHENNISDAYPFYAPGRFALDPDSLPNKWTERARAGFWVGRNIEFVMARKTGSAVWWDGHIFRTTVNNYYIDVSRFLTLTAPGNALLPTFPHDPNPIPAAAQAEHDTANMHVDGNADDDSSSPPSLPANSAASTRPQRVRAPIERFSPAANAAQSLAAPKPARDAVHVVVPARLWPNERCNENDGKGWTARVLSKSQKHVTVQILAPANADGKPWAPVTLEPSTVIWDMPAARPASDDACLVCDTPVPADALTLKPECLASPAGPCPHCDATTVGLCTRRDASPGGPCPARICRGPCGWQLPCVCQHTSSPAALNDATTQPVAAVSADVLYGPAALVTQRVQPELPLPSQDVVLNIGCGDYDCMNGISALLRSSGIGVVDIDNHPEYGGGQRANLLANSVFNAVLALCKMRRVRYVIVQPGCGVGSVVRAREGPSHSEWPQMVLNNAYPDGLPNLELTHKAEVHGAALFAFRAATICSTVFHQGGSFLVEASAMRGDPARPVTYDPSLRNHSSVLYMSPWAKLVDDTGALRVSAAMCALREGYPQKLEDYIVSPDQRNGLAHAIEQLQCMHPPGTHKSAFTGTDFGGLSIKSSQKWLPEWCQLLHDAICLIVPTGGPSYQFGRTPANALSDGIISWMEQQVAQEHGLPAEANSKAACMLSILHATAERLTADSSPSFFQACDVDAPIAHYPFYLELDTHDDGKHSTLQYVQLDRHVTETGVCYLTAPLISQLGELPQSDAARRVHPQRVYIDAADAVEIDRLWAIPTFREILANDVDWSKVRKPWKTKFVRKLKGDDIRSRLVMVGPQHEQGHEFYDNHVPTPYFATTLLLFGSGTVLHAVKFQFDMSQFFQTVRAEVPDGMMVCIPPPNYQRKEKGVRVLWECINWLQGAKGAGASARREFVKLVTAPNAYIQLRTDPTDACLFLHDSPEGKLRFALHGDDGCGGWTTNRQLAEKLEALLRTRWKDVKWSWEWGKTLGFNVSSSRGFTTITAADQIAGLRKFVEGDMPISPKMPYSKSFYEIEPATPPPEESPLRAKFEADVSFMRESGGAIQYILKVRFDAVAAHNQTSRYAHLPTGLAIKCRKHLIWYLLSTPHVGITYGYGMDTSIADLQLPAKLPPSYELTLFDKRLYYHVVLDGNLGTERSVSGIIHLFAGAAFITLSFRQHSQAITAHDSEVFTASTGTAQAIPHRDLILAILGHTGVADTPTPIFSDSASTLSVARNQNSLKKSLYLLRRVVFMHEAAHDDDVSYHSCEGRINPADPLTKYLLFNAWKTAMYYITAHSSFAPSAITVPPSPPASPPQSPPSSPPPSPSHPSSPHALSSPPGSPPPLDSPPLLASPPDSPWMFEPPSPSLSDNVPNYYHMRIHRVRPPTPPTPDSPSTAPFGPVTVARTYGPLPDMFRAAAGDTEPPEETRIWWDDPPFRYRFPLPAPPPAPDRFGPVPAGATGPLPDMLARMRAAPPRNPRPAACLFCGRALGTCPRCHVPICLICPGPCICSIDQF